MNETRVLEMELRSDPAGLPAVRERLRSWAAALGWGEQPMGELILAIDEALTNVIRHGYEGRCDGRIVICATPFVEAGGDEGLEIRIRDFGRQVDPAGICGRDLEDVRPGGLGVHIIHSMTSSAEYRPAEGGGMLLILRKYKTHSATGNDQQGRTT